MLGIPGRDVLRLTVSRASSASRSGAVGVAWRPLTGCNSAAVAAAPSSVGLPPLRGGCLRLVGCDAGGRPGGQVHWASIGDPALPPGRPAVRICPASLFDGAFMIADTNMEI